MVIVIQCTDKVGLVATIARLLQEQDLNIISMREHVDSIQNRFFARVEISKTIDALTLESQLKSVLPPDAQVIVNPNPVKKIMVFVTKEYHCLSDILIRNHFNTLGAKVLGVIGNHPTLEDICRRFDMPFHLVSHEGISKEDFEATLLDVFGRLYCISKVYAYTFSNFCSEISIADYQYSPFILASIYRSQSL